MFVLSTGQTFVARLLLFSQCLDSEVAALPPRWQKTDRSRACRFPI